MRFRERLAQQVGIDDFRSIESTVDPRFEKIKSDPIVFLLAHSDCDGHITPAKAKKLAPRILELIKDWPDHDYDKTQAIELVKGLKKAAKTKKNLEFT